MEYSLKVDASEAQVIGAGLGELPLKVSGALFTKLAAQVREQDEAAAKPAPEVAA